MVLNWFEMAAGGIEMAPESVFGEDVLVAADDDEEEALVLGNGVLVMFSSVESTSEESKSEESKSERAVEESPALPKNCSSSTALLKLPPPLRAFQRFLVQNCVA